ncbi:MAG: hypothetical protein C0490_18825 [Marivirga sp.]|nr:hypothetical protein [Marivirga sp.]
MNNAHGQQRTSTLLKTRKIVRQKAKRVVVRGNKVNPEDRSTFSETFLLGSLSDLLYEIKSLAKANAGTRNSRIKKDSITKLKTLLGRYRNLLGVHFKEIISIFIYDTFKSQRVPHPNLNKIKTWWLKM